MSESYFVDWQANAGRRRIQVLLVLFRLAQDSHRRLGRLNPVRVALCTIYRQLALNLFAVDLPQQTQVGPGLRIHHGFGLVVHGASRIGMDVVLRHGVTLGARGSGAAPVIGDRVDVGAAALVLGGIVIGEDVRIGAGAVVLKDVPAGWAVAGNPATRLQARHVAP